MREVAGEHQPASAIPPLRVYQVWYIYTNAMYYTRYTAMYYITKYMEIAIEASHTKLANMSFEKEQ